MIKTKSFLIVSLAVVMVVVTSCKEANLFNEEDYNRYVDTVFPVEDIDSQQSWSTTYKYPFRIGIEYDGAFTLKFYSENPSNVSSRLLNTCYVDGNNKSYVVTLNWEYNESLPDRNRVISKVSAIENQGGVIKPYMGNALTENNKTFYPAEMEGIKVDTSGTKPVMYLGYKCYSRKANILKYIYNK